MRDRKSQVGSDTQGKTKEENEKVGGLEFMSIRYNLINAMRYLRNEKLVTPAEKAVLEELQTATLFAENNKRTILPAADICLKTLSEKCGYKKTNKIWVLLKNLNDKYLITREPSQLKGHELLGLNPYYFGQILIDKQHESHMRRLHLKLVHNSMNGGDNSESEHTNYADETHEPCVDNAHNVCADNTQRVCSGSDTIEIIDEKSPLDPFLDPNINLSLDAKLKNLSFTLPGMGTGKKQSKQLSDPQEEKQRQLRMLREQEEKERIEAAV